jgi:hypothetical protein
VKELGIVNETAQTVAAVSAKCNECSTFDALSEKGVKRALAGSEGF